MIGSTANIVALGMLEKRYREHIRFWDWFKVGIMAGGVSTVAATVAIIVLAPLMPNRPLPKEDGLAPAAIQAPAEPAPAPASGAEGAGANTAADAPGTGDIGEKGAANRGASILSTDAGVTRDSSQQ
jgi:hypothetical protein